MAKDIAYYDAESGQYSKKRYPERAATYVQSFFLRRLALLTGLVCEYACARPVSLLEIGCADGVILRKLFAALPEAFSSMEGVDISPRMVEAARKLSEGLPMTFAARTENIPPRDLVIEIGVLNYVPDFEQDIARLYDSVVLGGRAIISIAGTGSLWHRLKRTGEDFAHFLPYRTYEAALRKRFAIIASEPVGLFIPYLWRLPGIARFIQPTVERMLALVAPGLFHEKVYVLVPLPNA
jgi:SAM-dependent methyltransferase